ncbi:MFS transporter [Chloroflexota bacterium]
MVKDSAGIVNKIINLQMFSPFHHRNFSLIFLSSITDSIGMFMSMVAMGWLILELTDSPLSLGLVWAIRKSPQLLLGIMAGVIADRVDRRKLLILAHIGLAICSFIIGVLITTGIVQLWQIFLITFIMGILQTHNFPARQALVIDIVGREGAMSAISINAVGMRVIGVFGGAAAGFVVALFGLDWPFYIMTITYLIGAVILLLIRNIKREISTEQQSIWTNFMEGIAIIGKNRVVLTLMIMAGASEALGFSYSVVLPVFARDVLEVGAIGLGMFSTASSIGGLIGGLALASLGNYRYKGRLILGIFLFFGVSLILFSQSPWYPVSLLVLALVGAMTAGHDAMQHIMLQLNVSEDQRGRAMGIWMLSIGFGLIGQLEVGAVADAIGAPIAVTINGALMVVIFIALVLFASKLRKA